MKTAILASTLLLGFTVASTSASAEAIKIDSIDVADFSVAVPEQIDTTPLLQTVKGPKGHRGGHNRGGHNRGGRDRDRNNLASDGNIGNGTLRARIQNEDRHSSRRIASTGNRSNGSGPLRFLRRIFGN